jgi:hypothetical protein
MVGDSEIGLGSLTDNIGSVGCARGIVHFNDMATNRQLGSTNAVAWRLPGVKTPNG